MSHENGRGRLAGNQTTSNANHDDQTTVSADRPRCAHCGHVIWSAESIRAGIGRDCRRAVVR